MLGRAGRALVEAKYSWASAVERLEELYARIEEIPPEADLRQAASAAVSSPS